MDWENAGRNALGGGGSSNFNWGGALGGLGGILGGILGGDPYGDAGKEYEKWAQKGIGAEEPFRQAGIGAIGGYNDWLGGMKDPSGFIDKIMGQYQESPQARYLQEQAKRAGINAASASGLAGSTPFAQQQAQQAAGISQNDMNNWLGQVLGINSQYGAGLGNEMGLGAQVAGNEAGLYGKIAQGLGEAKYGQKAQEGENWGSILGGIGSIIGSLGSLAL